MAYEKGSYVGDFKVSLLLKSANGRETYRVRDAGGLLRILKLGASAAELSHAEASPLFIDKTDDYVVYRYVNGETLEGRLLRLKALADADALALATAIARQLADLHGNGVSHRGISPDNVMLDLTAESPLPYLVGMSHAGEPDSESVRSDLEAMGKVINFMLTGEFSDRVKVNAGKMSLLETVMVKALQSEFASADDLLQALEGKAKAQTVRKSPKGGFAAVAGMETLKEQLQAEVIDVLSNKDEADKYGIEIPNGMLLYGPPGCGKSYLAERFAEEAGYNYKYVKSSDLASTYLHGSQEKIAALFDEARSNAPTILCFDEFDALVPKRDDVNNASHSGEVNEFLSQLNNCGHDGVFVIATSNRPDKIDSAILRTGRIDYMVYVPLPDLRTRESIFEIEIKGRPHDDDLDFTKLAKQTECFLASDIAATVQQAARMAFKQKAPISMAILLSAIESRNPSLSKSALAEYENLRANFESKADKGCRRVGFI